MKPKERALQIIASERLVGRLDTMTVFADDPLFNALYVYLARRFGYSRAPGFWVKNYWFPHPIEVEECCKRVHVPTHTGFSSYRRHCMTTTHMAHKHKCDPAALLALARCYIKMKGDEKICEDWGSMPARAPKKKKEKRQCR